jgi:hypothetical protein
VRDLDELSCEDEEIAGKCEEIVGEAVEVVGDLDELSGEDEAIAGKREEIVGEAGGGGRHRPGNVSLSVCLEHLGLDRTPSLRKVARSGPRPVTGG